MPTTRIGSCPFCGAKRIRYPSVVWRLAHWLSWPYAAVTVVASTFQGPGLMFSSLPLAFLWILLINGTHRLGYGPPRCKGCLRDLDPVRVARARG